MDGWIEPNLKKKTLDPFPMANEPTLDAVGLVPEALGDHAGSQRNVWVGSLDPLPLILAHILQLGFVLVTLESSTYTYKNLRNV